ncbi:hypothetical protein SAZ10_33330 [Mesorhizobium sp. BAC0120]|uniref:hypothetical protein n=1 Tax=Mesorhizobium sp. BAC0120 TaxID=3090670 RepID=UPI00298C452E|nr:hypothetical protein [Mesorhizobium sp. BAC0120]MDW6026654.1 hypothetical protein [Mesorhizobium sp. BAC0120]
MTIEDPEGDGGSEASDTAEEPFRPNQLFTKHHDCVPIEARPYSRLRSHSTDFALKQLLGLEPCVGMIGCQHQVLSAMVRAPVIGRDHPSLAHHRRLAICAVHKLQLSYPHLRVQQGNDVSSRGTSQLPKEAVPGPAGFHARLPAVKRRMNPLSGNSYEGDEIAIICPACNYELRKSIGWIRKHTQLECLRCGRTIDIESRNFRIPGRTQGTDNTSS